MAEKIEKRKEMVAGDNETARLCLVSSIDQHQKTHLSLLSYNRRTHTEFDLRSTVTFFDLDREQRTVREHSVFNGCGKYA
jgi:hypothetical protein